MTNDIAGAAAEARTLPKPGDIFELTVSDLTVEGGAMARHNGLVFFLDRGLPEEKLKARVESVTPRFARASVLETVTPSPHSAEPFCEHFGNCGGCAWQNLAYQAQLDWKTRQIKENLKRLGRVDYETGLEVLEKLEVLPSPELAGFRNKMEYVFARAENRQTVLGLRHRGLRSVEPIKECKMQSPLVAEVLREVKNWADEHSLQAWNEKEGELRFLVIREQRFTPVEDGVARKQLAVELISGPKPPEAALARELGKRLEALGASSFTHSARRDKNPLAFGEKILFSQGQEYIYEQFGQDVLAAPVSGFMQTNGAAAALLRGAVQELFSSSGFGRVETLWDVYCGSGFFGLALAKNTGKLVGFEQDKKAVRAARKNALDLGLENCRFWDGDAEQRLREEKSEPQCIVVDPPRAGLSEKVCEILRHKRPRAIIYVSCAPATLARDLARLSPQYRLSGLKAVDMFPHTPHVECVALLEKRP